MRYFVFFLLTIFSVNAYSQAVSCQPNTDFEYGSFSYWQFFQGSCCIPFTVTTSVTPPATITLGRETITSGTGTDPYGGFPVVAAGGSYSLKLGMDDSLRKADRARYYVHVPSSVTNYALIYRYAIVMEDPGHMASQQPRFEVNTTDSATGNSVNCGHFLYVAGSLPGFSLSAVGTHVYYKPWSLATINLTGYNGHTIIVDFTRGDCDLGAHFGYGYVDMTCGLFAVTINPCHYSLTTTLSGPPGFHTYTWMDSAMSTTIDTGQTIVINTPSRTTTYRLILTPYSGYGCTDTLSTTVIISNLALHPHDTTICTGKTISLNSGTTGGNAPLSYSWTPVTGLSCVNCVSPSVTPGSTKKYYVTVADSNGCSRTDSVNVKVNPLPAINAGADKTICFNSTTTLTARGGAAYVWSPATGLSCDSCSNPTASPASTTTYIVTGTDTNSCVNTDTVIVRVNTLPNVSAGPDKTICRNGSATLVATGAPTYSWSPTTGLSCSTCSSPVASPTTTTTYVVKGTDTNNCVNTDTVLVKVNQLPIVGAGNDDTICRNSSANLLATGANTYVWSPATGLSCSSCYNPTASPATTTTYVVTGTDTNTCVNIDTVVVKVNQLPNVNAGADKTICNGNNTSLTATGANTYIWTPATGLSCSTCATPTATPNTTTTYVVTGTDTNRCVSADTVIVHVNPLPNVNAGPDRTICKNSSVNITVTGAYTYSWSPTTGLSCSSCANPTASPVVTTTYVVTGTDTNGCVNRDTIVIHVNQLPNVSAGPDKIICFGNTASLSVTGATTYVWSPTTGLSCSNCSNPVASPGNTTTYVVTGTDTNNCVNTDTIVVKVNTLPTVSAGNDKTICVGSSTALSASGAHTYVWSPVTGLSCSTCSNPVATPTNTTTYTVTGTDTNSCVNMDTVIVHVNTLPNVNAGPDVTICNKDTITLSASGAFTYSWSPTTGLSCSSCVSPKAYPATTTTYIVTGTDTNSCTKTDTVVVYVNPLPNVDAGPDRSFCQGDSVSLSVSGARNYVWSPSTGLSCSTCSSPTATPATSTTYIVTGSDSNGCVNTDTITVKVNGLPNVYAGPDTSICNNSSITITAVGASTYVWSPPTGLSCPTCATTKVAPGSTTSYIVKGIDANDCVNRDTITISVMPKPFVQTRPDTSICPGASLLLAATGGFTYIWSPAATLSCISCDTTIAKPTGTTTYTVVGVAANGCSDTAHVVIGIRNPPTIHVTNDTVLCDGKSIKLKASGALSYKWTPPANLSCANCSGPSANPTNDMTYVVTGADAFGCIDSNEVTIHVIKRQIVSVSKDDTICQGQSVQLLATGGTSYLWWPGQSLNNDEIPNPVARPTNTTLYGVIIKQGDCFTDTGYINVMVVPVPTVYLGADTTILAGSSVQLNATVMNAISYAWSPPDGLSCIYCPNPLATPKTTTTYVVFVKGFADCDVSANITIHVKCEGSQLFIPNTFTPNGDDVNDKFYPSGKGIQEITRMSIYDRWGELLYNRNHFQVNDPAYGWDGTYKGSALKPDVYVYIIEATCQAGESFMFKGDVSLIK